MTRSVNISEHIRPILAAIRTVPIHPKFGDDSGPIVPFVTVSREVGAGSRSMATALVDALNHADPGEQLWTCWDRELVEKVAADHHLSRQLVESLEVRDHSWLGDFFASLTTSNDPAMADDMKVFGGVATTVRAMASTGRVVIVGRGGVLLTRKLPGGVHVRLVAPLADRIAHIAQTLNLPTAKAAEHVREMTRRRDAFIHRYWPGETLAPERFTVTLNTASVSTEALVRVIVELVRDVQHGGGAAKRPQEHHAGA